MKRPKGEFHEVDKYRLDMEWVRQPKMTRYYNEVLAKAKKELSAAKAAFKVREATLSKKIRTFPKKYGLAKITEAAINEIVVKKLFGKNSSVHNRLIEAEYNVNLTLAATETCRDRRKALEDLVALWFAGYFADAKNPKHVSREQIDEMKERMIAGVRPKKHKKGRAA